MIQSPVISSLDDFLDTFLHHNKIAFRGHHSQTEDGHLLEQQDLASSHLALNNLLAIRVEHAFDGVVWRGLAYGLVGKIGGGIWGGGVLVFLTINAENI